MKVFRNGIEIKGAKVIYGDDNLPKFVVANGLRQLASAFTFEDKRPTVKTKAVPESKKK